jgi:exodeoxyribonuclease V alpha subunit
MASTPAHLGLSSVFESHSGSVPSGENEFHSKLRQIETGVETFNLDSSVVHIAAEIAAFESSLALESRLALIMLIVASMVALEEGSTRLPVTGEESIDSMRRILEPLCGDQSSDDNVVAIANRIDDLLASGAAETVIGRHGDEYKPLLYIPPFIYHQKVFATESRLVESFRPRFAAPRGADVQMGVREALADVDARPSTFDGHEMAISEEQRSVIINATQSGVALISGGPGTGKTSIILAILRVLVRLGVKPSEIELAAPTGRAAFRMAESLRRGLRNIPMSASADEVLVAELPEARTIHRLLGYSPSRQSFSHHCRNPLAAAVVVVDECSMLDLMLTERLVTSMHPDTKLIMLGDSYQLPSVTAGAVFRDLVKAGEERFPHTCSRLTHNFRTAVGKGGKDILDFSTKINDGVFDGAVGGSLSITQRKAPEFLQFEGIEFIVDGKQLDEFLDRWYVEQIKSHQIKPLRETGIGDIEDASEIELQNIFVRASMSRILCATRGLLTGTKALNEALHLRTIRDVGRARERWGYLPGEPIMVVRNDYDRMLFNGDQGIIVAVQSQNGRVILKAVFRRNNEYVAFHLATLRDNLELSYATTVHKAQGSEFESVAIVLPDKDLPILTRELVYTAVSRARNSVVILGDPQILANAIARKEMRYSGMRDFLLSPEEPQMK